MEGSAVKIAHVHEWKPEPEFSGTRITRYRCEGCGAWGHRTWPAFSLRSVFGMRPKVPLIRVYAKGFDVEAYRARVAWGDLDEARRWEAERAKRRERGLEP